MEQNVEPIQTEFKSRFKEWYILREKIGKEKTFGDSPQRAEKLENLEKENISKLEKIQETIEKHAKAIGVEFDPKTGEVNFDSKKEEVDNTSLDETSAELSKNQNEHNQITSALYGDAVNDDKEETVNDGKEDTTKNKGIVGDINERKHQLMNRDVTAKKILQERAVLEKLKDQMDMEGAIFVAQKTKMMMRLEQAKLELVKSVARGNKEDSPSVISLKEEIAGLTQDMKDKEIRFMNSRASKNKEFNMARNALDSANKSYQIEVCDLNSKNKYQRNLEYSKDGVLNGSSLKGIKDDRSCSEKELFDERGVIILDVADVISREKSINIDGTVISCVTEFGPGRNVEDSFYVGDSQIVETNTNADTEVKNDPDMGKVDAESKKDDKRYQFYLLERNPVNTNLFLINGIAYTRNTVSNVPEEQHGALNMGLKGLGFNSKEKNIMFPASMSLIMHYENEKRKIKDIDREYDREIKGPFENS